LTVPAYKNEVGIGRTEEESMAVASRPSATSITAGTNRTIADRKRHASIET
jgi:hypothetical protein